MNKLKQGQKVQSYCLNCHSHHHAWFLRCPERQIKLQKPNNPDLKLHTNNHGNHTQKWTPVASNEFTRETTNSSRLYSKVVSNTPTEIIYSNQQRPPNAQRTPSFAPPSETSTRKIDTHLLIMEQANQMLNHLAQLISNLNTIITTQM